jgi:hypothetical protein
MAQNYAAFIFSFTFFFLFACENIDSPVNSQVQPDSVLPTGIWQVDYIENFQLFGKTQELKYIVFDKDKNFYFLYSDSINLRKQWTGVYAKPEGMNQLVFSINEMLNYSLSENLEQLTLYGNLRYKEQVYIKGQRLNNIFNYKEFIETAETEEQISLSINSNVHYYNSIADNGDYFWLYNHFSTIFKIDKTGSILDTLDHQLVPGTINGLAYEDDKLWIKSDNTLIYEYSFSGPEIEERFLNHEYFTQYDATDISISDTHIWMLSGGAQRVFKINKENLSLERTFIFTHRFNGISYTDNSLYLNYKDKLHQFSLESQEFENSFKIIDLDYGYSSTFNDSTLWIIHSREGNYSISGIKFN